MVPSIQQVAHHLLGYHSRSDIVTVFLNLQNQICTLSRMQILRMLQYATRRKNYDALELFFFKDSPFVYDIIEICSRDGDCKFILNMLLSGIAFFFDIVTNVQLFIDILIKNEAIEVLNQMAKDGLLSQNEYSEIIKEYPMASQAHRYPKRISTPPMYVDFENYDVLTQPRHSPIQQSLQQRSQQEESPGENLELVIDESADVLLELINQGNLKGVKDVLNHVPKSALKDVLEYDKSVLLVTAIQLKEKDIIQELLNYGADPNGYDNFALTEAIGTNDFDIFMMLIKAGAKLWENTRGDLTSSAKHVKNNKVLAYFKKAYWLPEDDEDEDEDYVDEQDIKLTAEEEDIVDHAVQVLLKVIQSDRSDIKDVKKILGSLPIPLLKHVFDYDKSIVLTTAVELKKKDIIKELLKYGANPNGYDNFVLIEAIGTNDFDIFKMLIDAGAILWQSTKEDLMSSAKHVKNNKVLNYFKKAYWKPSEDDEEEYDAQWEESNSSMTQKEEELVEDTVEQLVKAIESKSGKAYDIRTILHPIPSHLLKSIFEYNKSIVLTKAVELKKTNIIKELLLYGADPNGYDNYVLTEAIGTNNFNIFMLLMDAGARLWENTKEDLMSSAKYVKNNKVLEYLKTARWIKDQDN